MKPGAQYRHITDALVWGGVLIAVGGVLLLNSLGIVSWDLWQFLWRFWPIFLIIAGLNVVLGSTRAGSIAVGIISIVLLLGAIAYSIVVSGSANVGSFNLNWDIFNFSANQANQTTTSINVGKDEYTNVAERSIDINIGSANFVLIDNNEEYFLDIQAKHPQNSGEPELKKSLNNGLLSLGFTTKPGQIFSNGERVYNLALGQSDLHTEIIVDLASGSGNIDLDNVEVGKMDLEVDSGNMDVTLAKVSTPNEKSFIQVNSGTFAMYLDKSVGVKVTYKVNSGTLKIGDTEIDGRGLFTSDNYAETNMKLELDLEVNSGNAGINFVGATVNES